jgi:hypothetical protein
MPGDQYEPNRVLGFPLRRDPNPGQGGEPQRVQAEEPQRVMGFPVDRFGRVDTGWLQSLAHPVRGWRRWLRRRRLGPYATGDDEPSLRR